MAKSGAVTLITFYGASILVNGFVGVALRFSKDLDLSEIKNLKIKFGNDSVMQYKTRKTDSRTLDRSFKSSRIFHWEFERNISMAENRDKTAYDALNTRFEARTSEWRARIN